MASQNDKLPGAARGNPAAVAKAERLAAALRANLKRRKSQARDRAELEQDMADEAPKTR
ncbi:hypothetical protein [Dongia rigui]|uniref:Uncharacterized protein n=1 Tax=Dongia rigui TaxID=940149 RepID=A0ABU5E1B2_9PROT|nr:hypothetical protein [Dongia rigui]MDY0873341.1 hypothetical protein [Dongia rigui]